LALAGLNMSQDPDDWWHDEYFEQIGRQEDIAKALKDISEEGAREYLGTYGDAIDKRFDLVMAQAKYARQHGYPHFAILGAVTAIELITKHMLFRPLLQGAFLSDAWAQILTRSLTNARSKQERDILPQILELHGIKIKDLTLSDNSAFWDTLTNTVIRKRNLIAHEGEFATPAQADLALECAGVLWSKIVLEVAKKLGFKLEDDDDEWCDGVEEAYEPKDPFQ
jgi:hypothetical protein